MIRLEDLGWTPRFQAWRDLEPPDLEPWRIASEAHGIYDLLGVDGRVRAIRHPSLREHVCVGDWVLAEPATDGSRIIRRALPRYSVLERQAAGRKTGVQRIGANLDVVLVVTSANRDFNLRRIERYLAIVAASGATPVLVLAKTDLLPDPQPLLQQLRDIAPGVDIIPVGASDDTGILRLRDWLAPGRTLALVGSSGVGKSTLVNRLVGHDLLATSAIRHNDDRGRHTTTARNLILLPDRMGLLLDTPGMREVQLWTDPAEHVEQTFHDIAELAEGCRFADCTHGNEPDCAVRHAVDNGTLDPARLDAWQRLRVEAAAQVRRIDDAAARQAKQQARALGRAVRQVRRISPKYR